MGWRIYEQVRVEELSCRLASQTNREWRYYMVFLGISLVCVGGGGGVVCVCVDDLDMCVRLLSLAWVVVCGILLGRSVECNSDNNKMAWR